MHVIACASSGQGGHVVVLRGLVPRGAGARLLCRITAAALLLGAAAACDASDALAPDDVPTDVAPVSKPAGGGAGPASASPFASMQLHVSPTSRALKQADLWRTNRPADAAYMTRVGAHPVASWFNEWTGDVTTAVDTELTVASVGGRLAVLVAYNIPQRDCGLYSAGGASSPDAYRSWIRSFAAGFRGRKAVVVLEPDAIATITCLAADRQEERYTLLREAVSVLRDAGAMVYLEVGHARWLTPEAAAARLAKAGIDRAQGFALNVSNFIPTAENVTYGNTLSAQTGGKRYIIDTSRNGLGPAAGNVWCNPDGRALGDLPTTRSAHALVDALLWVKVPGESDGTCNGGPTAGGWWGDYALGLARRSPTL
ncbi:MAG: glycoside hydrolase family 6 protein [Gemmatimonadaceae bacterium]|nr:glycoside hydrolase family 6 protein [Gemmatimonadaceae bacterium]